MKILLFSIIASMLFFGCASSEQETQGKSNDSLEGGFLLEYLKERDSVPREVLEKPDSASGFFDYDMPEEGSFLLQYLKERRSFEKKLWEERIDSAYKAGFDAGQRLTK